jgi:hypothetical protein
MCAYIEDSTGKVLVQVPCEWAKMGPQHKLAKPPGSTNYTEKCRNLKRQIWSRCWCKPYTPPCELHVRGYLYLIEHSANVRQPRGGSIQTPVQGHTPCSPRHGFTANPTQSKPSLKPRQSLLRDAVSISSRQLSRHLQPHQG